LNQLRGVLRGARGGRDSNEFKFLVAETCFGSTRTLRRRKHALSILVLPGLGKSNAAHNVARSHGNAGIDAKDHDGLTGRRH
jgi:hypothetical protein